MQRGYWNSTDTVLYCTANETKQHNSIMSHSQTDSVTNGGGDVMDRSVNYFAHKYVKGSICLYSASLFALCKGHDMKYNINQPRKTDWVNYDSIQPNCKCKYVL